VKNKNRKKKSRDLSFVVDFFKVKGVCCWFKSMAQTKIGSRLVCVWLDKEGSRSKDFSNAQVYLRDIINFFRIFDDTNKCVDYILNMKNEKICLITSVELGKVILPFNHSFEQINSIYIFSSNKSEDQKWTNEYNKIQGTFFNIKSICDQLKSDTTRCEKSDYIGISFVSSSDISSRDINRQDPSFMYAQLLKEILLNDHLEETDEQTKRDMIIFCRQFYTGNERELNIFNEFEREFFPEHAIYWYTRECFIYKILNKALWTLELDILYK
jgi:hypothetical protein